MSIQPLPPSHPPEISVTEAIEPAYTRVKQMLFQPFDFTKWIIIGFCAWLAGFCESGGGGFNGGNYSGGNHTNNTHGVEDFRHFCHQVSDYVVQNIGWIVPLAIFLFVLFLAIWAVFLWLGSRGKFMFLHCVALNVAEVDVPWRKYAAVANSLFRFRLGIGLIGMIMCLPMIVLMLIDIFRMVLAGEPDMPGILMAAGLFLALMFLGLVFGLIHKFTTDFVVPIQFLRGSMCMAAWREFWSLLAANPGRFTVYILFQIVLGMAIGALVLAAFVVTCCIACCLSRLPFVGTVLLLPVLIFKRAYPLYYLAQYGPQYDVFPKLAEPPGAPPGPGPLPGLLPVA